MLKQEALRLALQEVPIYGFKDNLIKHQFVAHSDVFSYESYPFSSIKELVEFFLISQQKDFAEKLPSYTKDIDSVSGKILKSLEGKIDSSDLVITNALVSYLSKNGEFLLANKKAFSLADIIWNNAGDKSLDFNYYSKRVILAGIILFCFLHLARYQNKDRTKKFAAYLVAKSKNVGQVKNLMNRFFKFNHV